MCTATARRSLERTDAGRYICCTSILEYTLRPAGQRRSTVPPPCHTLHNLAAVRLILPCTCYSCILRWLLAGPNFPAIAIIGAAAGLTVLLSMGHLVPVSHLPEGSFRDDSYLW